MSYFKNCTRYILEKFGYQIIKKHDIKKNNIFLYAPRFTYGYYSKVHYLTHKYEMIKNLEGNIVECGVGLGSSFLVFLYLNKHYGRKGILWGFDSFEGFPEPTKYDESPRTPKKGEHSGTSIKLIENLTRACLDDNIFINNNVKLVKGFFDNTLEKYDGSPIALLHVDADLYESTKYPLEALYPFVVKRGIILFDEYLNAIKGFPGAVKAIDEFFKNKEQTILYDEFYDRYYIVKQ